MIVGQVVLGLAIRRSQPTGASWPFLLLASAGALLAVTVFADAWHDIGMFTFDAGRALFGVGLLRQRRALENSE
jgi:hypothetical protein